MISDKQKRAMAFFYSKYDALICDGSVRSGKTTAMFWGFVRWAMREFDGMRFIVMGKTVESAYRNVIEPFVMLPAAKAMYKVKFNRSSHRMVVQYKGRTNYFDVFGAKDESAYMLIQGFTAAGLFVDEVALCNRKAVEQAMARCSVDGSKFAFNCNPDSPKHWFYQEWILKAEEKNAYHIHFLLRDNPGLTERIIKRYESQYAGVFHDRYIKGLWTQAEGLIYPDYKDSIEETYTGPHSEECISVDFGVKNATAALKFVKGVDCWHCVDEYYYSGRDQGHDKTTLDYASDLQAFCSDMKKPVKVIVDPSASALIAELRRTGDFKVVKAKNDVMQGVCDTATSMRAGTLKIGKNCENLLDELSGYVWDEKSSQDKPIKVNDHACDALRYFVETKKIVKKEQPYKSVFER